MTALTTLFDTGHKKTKILKR